MKKESFEIFGFDEPDFEGCIIYEENNIYFGINHLTGNMMWDENGVAYSLENTPIGLQIARRAKYDLVKKGREIDPNITILS